MLFRSGDLTVNDAHIAETYCYNAAEEILEHEREMLKLLVEYDAAYRSVLQFAGIFDEFLQEYRWTLIGHIRQAASMIGWLDNIPCFLSSCDEYPPTLHPNLGPLEDPGYPLVPVTEP